MDSPSYIYPFYSSSYHYYFFLQFLSVLPESSFIIFSLVVIKYQSISQDTIVGMTALQHCYYVQWLEQQSCRMVNLASALYTENKIKTKKLAFQTEVCVVQQFILSSKIFEICMYRFGLFFTSATWVFCMPVIISKEAIQKCTVCQYHILVFSSLYYDTVN